MGFYTVVSHGKFHNRGYSDILNGITSTNIMGCCRGKLGNGERRGMTNRAISCRRGKSRDGHQNLNLL